MPLNFHPHPGMVLICDFDTGFKAPEMIKRRPVVVISPRPRRSNRVCTVVPLSTTAPDPIEPFHHRMHRDSLPGKFGNKETWAKCDMLATVSLARLDRVMIGKGPDGKRKYVAEKVLNEDLDAIRRGVVSALGLVGVFG